MRIGPRNPGVYAAFDVHRQHVRAEGQTDYPLRRREAHEPNISTDIESALRRFQHAVEGAALLHEGANGED